MIVSSSSLLHHRVGGGGGGLEECRAASRCSLEMMGDAAAASSSKMSSPSPSGIVIPPLALISPSSSMASTMTDEEEEEELSSPASSGYGRSATSESDELRHAAARCCSTAAATAARRAGGGAETSGGRWSMPRHPFLSAIGRFLPEEEIEHVSSLGEGFFSVVDKVHIRSTGEILVRKVAKPGVRGERRETHADVAREAKMLRRLEHDNVLGLRGMCIVQSEIGAWDLHLLLDYCEGGSLSRLLLDHSIPLPWRHRFSYAVDIARGMNHIHSRRVIHRDLTSMNVLIQHSSEFPSCGRAVIADFGLSCDFPRDGEKLSQVGTTYFMSPECLKEQHYDEKSDVFSFGIILCQLIARIDADPEIGLHRTADFGLNYRLFITYCPTDTRMEMLRVAFGCCLMDPSYRLSFSEILSQLQRVLQQMNKQAAAAAQSNAYSDDLSPGRLERSRSDAALRRPRAVHQRKYSAYHRPTIKPVTEGLAEEAATAEYLDAVAEAAAAAAATTTAAPAAETARPMHLQGTPLLRTAAGGSCCTTGRLRPLPSPMNPFSAHARFRSARKIVPSREEERDRRQSERQQGMEGEEEIDGGVGRRRRRGRMLRRCSSLPSEMDSSHSLDYSESESEEEGDYPDDDSMGDDDVLMTSPSAAAAAPPGSPSAAGAAATVDTLAKVFTEWDQKFLRQSRRFSTRRNTIMNGAVAATPTSAATAASAASVTPTVTSASSTLSVVPAAAAADARLQQPIVLSLSFGGGPSPCAASSPAASSVSYSPATGDRMNNNGASPGTVMEDALSSTLDMPTKYSSWPKRRESRIVRPESSMGICRSRNSTATRNGRSACSIL